MYLASIVDASLATPALKLHYNGTEYVAASLVKYPDGRQRMEFYVDQAAWALYPVLLGTAWLQWVSNGVFAGARRIEFNAHMDDIFMITGMFDPETGEEGEKENYRITPNDLVVCFQLPPSFTPPPPPCIAPFPSPFLPRTLFTSLSPLPLLTSSLSRKP